MEAIFRSFVSRQKDILNKKIRRKIITPQYINQNSLPLPESSYTHML